MIEFPRLKEILDAFLAPWSVAASIAVGSAALLILRWFGNTDLEALPPWAFGAAWVALVHAGVVLCIRTVQSLRNFGVRLYRRRRQRNRINQLLDTLSPEEREVIGHLLQLNQRSLTAPLTSTHLAALIQKGLLVRGRGVFAATDWPHTIPEDVWEQLEPIL